MIREEAITYFEGQKKRLEDFRKIYPSPDTIGYQAATKEISFYDMAISALSESDNVGMSMTHCAIAKVIDDYIANHQGDSDKQYTAHEIKALLISDDSDNEGEWIYTEDRPEGFCSKCDRDIAEAPTPYCPYCGAKMTWVGAVHEPKFGNSMLVGKPSLLNQIIPTRRESEEE